MKKILFSIFYSILVGDELDSVFLIFFYFVLLCLNLIRVK